MATPILTTFKGKRGGGDGVLSLPNFSCRLVGGSLSLSPCAVHRKICARKENAHVPGAPLPLRAGQVKQTYNILTAHARPWTHYHYHYFLVAIFYAPIPRALSPAPLAIRRLPSCITRGVGVKGLDKVAFRQKRARLLFFSPRGACFLFQPVSIILLSQR